MRRDILAIAIIMTMACQPRQEPAPASNGPKPLDTRTDATTTSYFGMSVADPYRWLEDGNAPEVKAWIDAENKHAESVMRGFDEGPAIAKRVEQLATTSPDRSSPQITGTTLFYLRETPPQPQPVLVAEKWPNGRSDVVALGRGDAKSKPRVVVDVNDAGGNVTITAYWPSPTGRYVAYGTAEGGSELTTIRVLDVTSGKSLADALPYAGGGTSPQALVWDADERGVTYARYPVPASGEPVRQFGVAMYHHTLGAPPAGDAAVFGVGYSPIAEYRLIASDDAKQAAALVNKGDGGFADLFVRMGGKWRLVLEEAFGVTDAAFAGDRLLVVATGGSPRGRIVAVARDGTTSEVLAEGDWAISSIAPIADGFLVVRVWGPRWRVDHYNAKARLVRAMALPSDGISISGIASSVGSSTALVHYSGWSIPGRWVKYDGESGALNQIFEVTPAADYSKIEATAIEATSKDGTKVPVTVLAMRGTPRDGTAPAILTGYGGFDIPTRPAFIGSHLAWLERGGVLAYANLRGGSEFGEAWHQAGRSVHKQNVFDDFHAAAQALVQQRFTSARRLGILGGSNGGLLMGAALTQHAEDFRAVASFVGIYDTLRHELFPNGTYNVTEYGSTENEAEFRALFAYSPYHHVKNGTSYPAVVMETGVNDPRVAPWQSRKFAAALQAATSSRRPVLLVTRTGAGHGVGAPFSQRVGNTALALTFLAHELRGQ